MLDTAWGFSPSTSPGRSPSRRNLSKNTGRRRNAQWRSNSKLLNKTSLGELGKQLKMRQKALPTIKSKESALRSEVKKARDSWATVVGSTL